MTVKKGNKKGVR